MLSWRFARQTSTMWSSAGVSTSRPGPRWSGEVFQSSDGATVHMKDQMSGLEGFLPFVRAVLGGLGGYQPRESPNALLRRSAQAQAPDEARCPLAASRGFAS